MPSNNSENFLERLNYFNGQRLDAEGLRVEQEYHIEMRRRLNTALYTLGIASGLEIRPDPDNTHQVIVSPGVALDVNGREVILLEETKVPVHGLPNNNSAWTFGNYLYIEYAEQQVATSNDGCNMASNKNEIAWGGPTRIRAIPKLAFADSWPNELKGPIILAQIELDSSCAVTQIHNAPRKYVDAAKSATRAVSYEGQANIDQNNSKKLSFHIKGGPAKSVTLYLWGEKFSSLYYSELGKHSHHFSHESENNTSQQHDEVTSHSHNFSFEGLKVKVSGSHPHKEITADVTNEADAKDSIKLSKSKDGNEDLHAQVKFRVKGGDHSHTLILPSNPTTDPQTVAVGEHSHLVEGETSSVGKRTEATVSGKSYKYFDDLQVYLDGDPAPITPEILSQLGWTELGDGSSGHQLVDEGSGPIALERIRTLNEGEHTLEFKLKVGNETGGKIRYNLYVE
jgi:hypothetical protein